jgi:hypothetical protein
VIRADEAFRSAPAQDATCAAEGVVSAVGLETLHQLGVSPAEIRDGQELPDLVGHLDEEQAQGVVDALLRCLDFGRVIGEQLAANTGNELTDDQVQCINDRIEDDPAVRDAIVRSYTGEPPAEQDAEAPVDILAVASECLPFDVGAGSASTTTP